jgi:hypothetical protein
MEALSSCRQQTSFLLFSSIASTCLNVERVNPTQPNRSINNTSTNLPHHTTNDVRLPHILPPRARRTHPQHHHPHQASDRRPTLQHHLLKKRQRRDRGQEPRLDPHHPQKGPAGCAVRQQQGGERVSNLGFHDFAGRAKED